MNKFEHNSAVAKIATVQVEGASSLPSLLRGSVYGYCNFNLIIDPHMRIPPRMDGNERTCSILEQVAKDGKKRSMQKMHITNSNILFAFSEIDREMLRLDDE